MHKLRTDIPSRTDVEQAIKCLEIEEQRERDAIRAYWKRERQQEKLSLGWRFAIFFGAVVAGSLFVWFWVVVPVIDALTGSR